MMTDVYALLLDGTLVDVALVALVVEAVVLMSLHRRGRVSMQPLDVLGHLAAGGLLLLALRCALTGASLVWVLVLMTASFPAHLLDLRRRARSGRPNDVR